MTRAADAEGSYQCPTCLTRFNRAEDYVDHYDTAHMAPEDDEARLPGRNGRAVAR